MKKNLSMFIAFVILTTVLTGCDSGSATNGSNTNASSANNSSVNASSADDSSVNNATSEVAGEANTQSTEAPLQQVQFSQISTTTLDGEVVTGDDIKGEKLTVINIWATSCPPCVEELPHIQEISETYAKQGVKIVGVMQDGITSRLAPDESTIEKGKTLLTNAGVQYTIILPDETIMEEFINQMLYLPTTFFLDSEGNVLKTVVGAYDANEWRSEIDAVLEEISK